MRVQISAKAVNHADISLDNIQSVRFYGWLGTSCPQRSIQSS